MKKILDIFLSTIYLIYFWICLLVFHVIQAIAFNFFGRKAHQITVHWLNFFLLHGMYLVGMGLKFVKKAEVPTDKPIIFIANHQSMFDIVGMIWYLRKYFPVFVSKVELSKNVPSISYNLRKSGAALIDRNDSKQAVAEIARMGREMEQLKFSAAIFPEGTRSRTGKLKDFQVGGVSVLLKTMPSAIVVPIAIRNTGYMNPSGFFPVRTFTKLSWTMLPPIERANRTPEKIVELAKQAIATELGQNLQN